MAVMATLMPVPWRCWWPSLVPARWCWLPPRSVNLDILSVWFWMGLAAGIWASGWHGATSLSFFSFLFSFLFFFFFFFVIQSMVFVSSNRWRCDDPQWNRAEVSADRDSKQGRRVCPGASCNTLEGGGGVLADCLLGSAGWARFGLMGGSVIYNFRGEFSEPFSVHKWWPWRPWRQPSFLFLVFVWIVFPRSNMEAYKQRQQVQHKNSHFILNIWIAERGKNSTFIYIMRFVKYSKVALK